MERATEKCMGHEVLSHLINIPMYKSRGKSAKDMCDERDENEDELKRCEDFLKAQTRDLDECLADKNTTEEEILDKDDYKELEDAQEYEERDFGVMLIAILTFLCF
jgi:hypothetical protein